MLRPTLTRRGRHAHHRRFRVALTLTDAAGNARHVAVRTRL
jgi:hypothetical protein